MSTNNRNLHLAQFICKKCFCIFVIPSLLEDYIRTCETNGQVCTAICPECKSKADHKEGDGAIEGVGKTTNYSDED